MRIFGRLLFSITAVGFFLLAFTYSRDLMVIKYFEEVFGESLVSEDSEYPDYYYFYTSIPDYHKNDPIILIDNNGYEIRGYEVIQASINNDNELELLESVYIIVYSDTEDLSQVGYINLENLDGSVTKDINVQRFKTLNMLNGINDQGYVYVPKDVFLSEELDTIHLVDKNENSLLETDFDLSETDFTIKTFISDFYEVNNRLPAISDLEGVTGNDILPNMLHLASDYVHIFYIAMGIYFTVLIISMYFIFFRKKKLHSINAIQ